jgi:hypothetical protein
LMLIPATIRDLKRAVQKVQSLIPTAETSLTF